MQKMLLLTLCVVVLFLSVPLSPAPTPLHAQDDIGGVSAERLARLQKGVNLSNWFWYGPSDSVAIRYRFSDAEFVGLREMGFTFVRVPIDFYAIADTTNPTELDPDKVALIDEAIARILAADLAVIVDMHSVGLWGDNILSGQLEDNPDYITTFLALWGNYAAYLTQYDPDWVFLEVLNEPVFYDNPDLWETDYLPQTVAAIREAAPEFTLIVSGTRWASYTRLLTMTPLDESNIIYNFHFYEPFVFTHQGADWAGDEVKPLHDVPYPATPEAIDPLLDQFDTASQQALMQYRDAGWNGEKIDAIFATIAAWGQAHGVPIICTEFGVFKNFAAPADRALWHHDMRVAFEKYGIGWAMWEYDREFGLISRLPSGKVRVDPLFAEALGLTLPTEGN